MNGSPDIIRTSVIGQELDVFWDENPALLQEIQPRPVLILSTTFAKDSAESAQLDKMLAACKLEQQHYNLIQLKDNERCAWHRIRDTLQVKTILLLGVVPPQLGISVQFMPHQVGRFDGCSWIQTLSLHELQTKTDIKNHLWNYGLKPVFVEQVYG